jgi:Zn-dependent peptidase ImmA (M78 family)
MLRVAQSLGAQVRPEFADDQISGALYYEDDGPVIGVNASHHPNRQRFTIAHECAHLSLHDQAVYVDRAYPSGRPPAGSPAFLRNAVSSDAVDPIEIEANRFAACLLMPKPFLLDDLRLAALPLTSETVAGLARRYDVSGQAMTYRLTNLGIPLDVGS